MKNLKEMTEWSLRLYAVGMPLGAIAARTGWQRYRVKFAVENNPHLLLRILEEPAVKEVREETNKLRKKEGLEPLEDLEPGLQAQAVVLQDAIQGKFANTARRPKRGEKPGTHHASPRPDVTKGQSGEIELSDAEVEKLTGGE